MLRAGYDSPPDEAAHEGWPRPSSVSFVTLWATGSDPSLDRLFRLLAMRLGEDGQWLTFDTFCDPFPERAEDSATARMVREFGVRGDDLRGAPPVDEAWEQFIEFLGPGPVFCPDGESLTSWWLQISGPEEADAARPLILGLSELAAMLAPGRLATRREDLVRALAPQSADDGPPAALHPPGLRIALAELVSTFLDTDARIVGLAATGYARAAAVLAAIDPVAAARLALALGIVEHPSAWAGNSGELFPAGGALGDGALSAAARLIDDSRSDLSTELDTLLPAVTRDFESWSEAEMLPPRAPGVTPFHPDDAKLLDDLFQVHLPARLAAESGAPVETFYRASQHGVAREVARTLGADELLLVHAPTGTGKTIAYLVPALLWARRHRVRVGVATYTRALQEQAMDREVPRTLSALARAGIPGGSRIALLKGRENYLCFRALKLATPTEDEEAEGWLAWTSLVLFALTDLEGDLDRLPLHPPVRLSHSARYRRMLGALVRQVRARSGCCTHKDDRSTCAAELARRRAERSHVVLTNHSFALARQEFFAHMVFDECEHLHDQAHNAWSHTLSFRRARDLLARLHRADDRVSRAALDRLARQLMPNTTAHDELHGALEDWKRTTASLGRLEQAAGGFDEWRTQAGRDVAERDEHGLFREYLERGPSDELLGARLELAAALERLDSSVSRLAEHLDGLPLRGSARVRRSLDLARADLGELADHLGAWIPIHDGAPTLRRETFYDVERNARGELVLAARVLLPNEYLGRNYYPTLASAVFLSATTMLQESFDAALGYLGLDRTANPRPWDVDDEDEEDDEPHPGRVVRTFSAPEVFDYSRVLVGVPRDAPDPRQKAEFLDYVTEFLGWLSERTRGRILALFTNLEDVRRVGSTLAPMLRERQLPLWYQGMEEAGKEELSELFRSRVDSVLLGVDTFWFGADFPGETLEYLVIVRLPYGVPDRYHHAQCAALGASAQRRRIYLPRALAKFRQGFGRLMRKTTDRGCVFMLDKRVLDPRHRAFLLELPTTRVGAYGVHGAGAHGVLDERARLVRGDTNHVLHEALAHMDMLADVRRRGLSESFESDPGALRPVAPKAPPRKPRVEPPAPPPRADVHIEDLPF